MSKGSILVVDDESEIREGLELLLRGEGYGVSSAETGESGLEKLEQHPYDLLLLDVSLPDRNGLDMLKEIHRRDPQLSIVLITAYGSIDMARAAFKNGAMDYITKPWSNDELLAQVAQAVESRRLRDENVQLKRALKQRFNFPNIVGKSDKMQVLLNLVTQVAPSRSTILISGESGTGKELVAKALHYASRRAAKPFVDVNCAAMTETLIESELFGHEKGSFTSAFSRRRGKFEQAHGGSFFLDEIGDMPLVTQAKMLRVLQERSFQRVGGEEKINVDVRVICATNQNLETCVEAGTFRLDLFYRINPLMIEVPPLQQRPSDIPELVSHFLNAASQVGNTHVRSVSDEAMIALQQHSWPGNVRELQNAIERAYTVCHEDEIQISHLPAAVLRRAPVPRAPSGSDTNDNRNLVEKTEQYERSIIMAELAKCEWNKTKAALALGVTRRILSYKMQTLGIDKPLPIVYNS